MNGGGMQEIISIFTGKYGLTRNEVVTEVEKVFSEILSRRYGCEVMAVFGQDRSYPYLFCSTIFYVDFYEYIHFFSLH